MDKETIEDLQCMVWHNNVRAEEMCWSQGKQSFFQWMEMKILVWSKHTIYQNIYVSEILRLY